MAMKYIGDGSHIHGVPARDLTDEEEKRFDPVISEQQKLTGMKLYARIAKAKSAQASKEDGEK